MGPKEIVSPLPKNGINIAKTTKGISIKALVSNTLIGILASKAAEVISKKYAKKFFQLTVGVATTTEIKRNAATILG